MHRHGEQQNLRTLRHTFSAVFTAISSTSWYKKYVWQDDTKMNDWHRYRKGSEKATKQIPELKHMNYIDRLKKCQLPTLHYRRIRGDMIETYKIVSGKYDSMAAPMIPGSH